MFIILLIVVVFTYRCIDYRRNQTRIGRHAYGNAYCCGCLGGASNRRPIISDTKPQISTTKRSHASALLRLNGRDDSYYGDYPVDRIENTKSNNVDDYSENTSIDIEANNK